MSKYLPAIITDLRKPKESLYKQHPYKYKTRFSLLGTVGSGKTTISALTVVTAQMLSSDIPGFKCRVIEHNSDIRAAASRLRRGRFPPKTKAYQPNPFEAGLLMYWNSWLGEKKVQVPISDISGEDVAVMIHEVHGGQLPDAHSFGRAQALIDHVKDSDGYILAVPASRALLFHDDTQLEPEPEDLEVDPDPNLARILEAVISHKELSHGKPIKGIAVIITKWDLIRPFAANWGMDIYDPSGAGLRNFMDNCFPDTSMVLKAYGLDKVRFFPSYVEVMRDGNNKLLTWDRDERGRALPPNAKNYRIKVTPPPERKPVFAESSYVALFEYLKTFAS